MARETSSGRGPSRKTKAVSKTKSKLLKKKPKIHRNFPLNFKDLLPPEVEISCEGTLGTWHSARFKRGTKSKCILHCGSWISPLQFIHLNNNNREPHAQEDEEAIRRWDWKEKIVANGSPIKSLFLQVRQCKGSCKCSLCFNASQSNAIEDSSPSPEASLLPPPPLRPSKGGDSEVSSDSGLSLQSATGGREQLLDLNSAVQRALASLEGPETSQLHILLFILNYYDIEAEDVVALNRRLKKTLEFLTRMDILTKGGGGGKEDSSDSEGEELPFRRQAPQAKKTRKLKVDPPIKVSKKAKLNSKENKIRKCIVQKPKNLSPALSNLCGGVKKLSRHDVLRKVWGYIKKRNLQDAERKNIVKCDEKLREVSKEDEFHFKNLFRLLDSHMT